MEKKKKDHHEQPEELVSGTDLPEGDEVEKLRQELQAKEAEAAANWEKFLRERADLENLRKRFQREKEELLKYGNESLILEILPAVDNLERALAHAAGEECVSAVNEGVRMTLSMLLSSLKKFGVVPVESKGIPFDPAFHQAMSQVQTDEVEPGRVVDEFQKAYTLNDRLLRPAMVTVSAPKKSE